jgi:nicotinamide-nucleotide amidase
MRAEVIAFGDELTSGQRLDTNSQWLSQRLGDLGVHVHFHSTVGDQLEDSTQAFRIAVQRADLVITTGGIGPTADDLTRHALAAATDRTLELNERVWEHIQALFRRRGRVIPERNRVQAMFPTGSHEIKNPNGTAPGIYMTVDRPERPAAHVFVLPGVPAEMREMWSDSLERRLKELLGPQRNLILHQRIKCFGAGESELEQMLPGLTERGRSPRVGITVHRATITLRVTAEGKTAEECRTAMRPTIDLIHQYLGPLVYGEEDDELQDAVARLLREQQRTLATVEIATEGLVARWLATANSASTLYQGGKVIPGEVWRSETGDAHKSSAIDISARVADMAREVRADFQADYGLAIGPVPESPVDCGSPPQIHVALATEGALRQESRPFASHPDIRLSLAAKHALNLIRLTLADQSAN